MSNVREMSTLALTLVANLSGATFTHTHLPTLKQESAVACDLISICSTSDPNPSKYSYICIFIVVSMPVLPSLKCSNVGSSYRRNPICTKSKQKKVIPSENKKGFVLLLPFSLQLYFLTVTSFMSLLHAMVLAHFYAL